jgi:hypothetical protein
MERWLLASLIDLSLILTILFKRVNSIGRDYCEIHVSLSATESYVHQMLQQFIFKNVEALKRKEIINIQQNSSTPDKSKTHANAPTPSGRLGCVVTTESCKIAIPMNSFSLFSHDNHTDHYTFKSPIISFSCMFLRNSTLVLVSSKTASNMTTGLQDTVNPFFFQLRFCMSWRRYVSGVSLCVCLPNLGESGSCAVCLIRVALLTLPISFWWQLAKSFKQGTRPR